MNNTSKHKEVFISHSKEDVEVVKSITDKLINKTNFTEEDIFCTSRENCNISPGNKWLDTIEYNLNNCKFFLILCTEDSIKSTFVWFELGHARSRHPEVRIIPIIINLEIKKLPPVIQEFQCIIYDGEDSCINEIIASLETKSIQPKKIYDWDRFNSSLDKLKKLFDKNIIQINTPQINLQANYKNIFDRLIKEGQIIFTTTDDGYIDLTRYNLPHNLLLQSLGGGYFMNNHLYYMKFISNPQSNPDFEKLLLDPKCKFSPNYNENLF